MALLEVTGLVRRFRGVAAVDGLSFSVEPGQTTAIIGPNGAGKTTTFNLISGLLPCDGGLIRFGDREITKTASHSRCRAGIARTFQLVQPFLGLSILENVMVGALFGAERAPGVNAARVEAERLCAVVGLADPAIRSVEEITGADRKRLEIARALATHPRLLLLDEVMEGLTPVEERDAVALLKAVRAQGVTLLLIEHVMSTVRDLSDHVVVMDYGKKLVEGPYEQVAHDPRVIEAYLGTEGAA